MNVEEFRKYCMLKKGITEEFPFDADTLVFKVMGKMFALVPLERIPAQANLKCNPEKAIALREQYDGVITLGFHMSKKHWNTIYMANLPSKFIEEQIDHSYQLVVSGLTKKLKEELKAL